VCIRLSRSDVYQLLFIMGYYIVESYMSKGPVKAQSNCICCAERRLIKTLFRECLKRGNKPHQFSSWVHRKYGELVVERKTCYGHGNSLPCVLCRKAIERIGLKWKAHDGRGWVHSKKSKYLPPSIPTNKQSRQLGFRRDNKPEC
jgi:hypothetical protein